MRRKKICQSQVDWINLHLFSHLIESDFNRTASVHRTVSAHGSTGWFVGPNPSTCVMERPEFVRSGGKNAVVIGRDVAKRGKAAPVNEGIDIKSGDSSFFIGSHLDFDVTGVTASINPVDFFTCEVDSNRPTCFTRENCSAHFVREWIRLATESTAHKCSNDVDLMHRNFENCGKCSVCIMRNLLRRVQLKTAVGIPMSNNCVRLCESVMYPFHSPLSMG